MPNQFSLRLALKPFRDSLRFRGRSTRTELLSFWMLYIAALALFVGAAMIGGAVFGANVADWVEAPGVILLAITFWLPAPALIARRLRDVGLPGWPGALFVAAYGTAANVGQLVDRTYLLPLAVRIVVNLAALALFVACLWNDRPEAERYGPDPRLEPADLLEADASV